MAYNKEVTKKYVFNHLSDAQRLSWADWLRDNMPLPQGDWVTLDGSEILDPQKFHDALLGELLEEGSSVRPKEAIRDDFKCFVSAYKVALLQEQFRDCESREDLDGLMQEVAEQKEKYSRMQLEALRQAAKQKLLELKRTPVLEPAGIA